MRKASRKKEEGRKEEQSDEKRDAAKTDESIGKSKFTLVSKQDIDQQSKQKKKRSFIPLQATAWGWNSERRTGNITAVSIPFPKQLQRTKDFCFIATAAGKHHALFISNTGNVYSIGDGRQGQLGYGNLFTGLPAKGGETQAVPRHVTPSGILKFGRDLQCIEVAAGSMFSISREMNHIEASKIIKGFLSLEAIMSYYLQIFPDSPAIRYAYSQIRQERCVINHRAEGKMLVWGTGNHGELGLGQDHLYTPFPMLNYHLHRVVVRQIAAGPKHVLAVTTEGYLYSWGCGKSGRLGHGDFTDRFSPELVNYCLSMEVVYIAAGDAHSAVLAMPRDDAVSIAQRPISLIHSQSIYAPKDIAYQEMLKHTTRKVLCFGRGAHGRLGHGTNRNAALPVVVKTFPPSVKGAQIVSLSCGGAHTLALLHKAVSPSLVYPQGIQSFVVAWGFGGNGQLGNGYEADAFCPVKVRLPKHELILQISAGRSWSVARTASGQLYTWGKGLHGQLGQGGHVSFSLAPRLTQPTLGDAYVLQVAAGYAHNVAIYVARHRHLMASENDQTASDNVDNSEDKRNGDLLENDSDGDKEEEKQARANAQKKKKAISSFAEEKTFVRGPLLPDMKDIEPLLTPGTTLSLAGHVSEALYQIQCCRRWQRPVYNASYCQETNTATTTTKRTNTSNNSNNKHSSSSIDMLFALENRRWKCLECHMPALCHTCLRLCHRGHHVKMLDPLTSAVHPDHRNETWIKEMKHEKIEISLSSKDAMFQIYKDAKQRWYNLRHQAAAVPTALVWLPHRLKIRVKDLYLPHPTKDNETPSILFKINNTNINNTNNNGDTNDNKKYFQIHYASAAHLRSPQDYQDELHWITLDKNDPKVVKQIQETKEFRLKNRLKLFKSLNTSLDINVEKLPKVSIYVSSQETLQAPSASFIPASLAFSMKFHNIKSAANVQTHSSNLGNMSSVDEAVSTTPNKIDYNALYLAGSCVNGTRSIARPLPMTYLSHPDLSPATFFSDMMKRRLLSCEFRPPVFSFPFFAKYQSPSLRKCDLPTASNTASTSTLHNNSMHIYRHLFHRIDTVHVDEHVMRKRKQQLREQGIYHSNRVVSFLADMETRDLDQNARLLLKMQQEAIWKQKKHDKLRVKFASKYSSKNNNQNSNNANNIITNSKRGRSVSPVPRDTLTAGRIRSQSLPPPPKPSHAVLAAEALRAKVRVQRKNKQTRASMSMINGNNAHPFLSSLLTSGSINIQQSMIASKIITNDSNNNNHHEDNESVSSQTTLDHQSIISSIDNFSHNNNDNLNKRKRKQGFSAAEVRLLARVYYRIQELSAAKRLPAFEKDAFSPVLYLQSLLVSHNTHVRQPLPTSTQKPLSTIPGSSTRRSMHQQHHFTPSYNQQQTLQQQFLLNLPVPDIHKPPTDPDLPDVQTHLDLDAPNTVWGIWVLAEWLWKRHVTHLRKEAAKFAKRQQRRSQGGSVELKMAQIDHQHIEQVLQDMKNENESNKHSNHTNNNNANNNNFKNKWIISCHCSLYGMDSVTRNIDQYLIPHSAKLTTSYGTCHLLPTLEETSWEHLSHIQDPLLNEDTLYHNYHEFFTRQAPMRVLHPLAVQAAEALDMNNYNVHPSNENNNSISSKLSQSMKSLYATTLSPGSMKSHKKNIRKSITNNATNNVNTNTMNTNNAAINNSNFSSKMFGKLFTSQKVPMFSLSRKHAGTSSENGDETQNVSFLDPIAYQQAQCFKQQQLKNKFPLIYAQQFLETYYHRHAIRIQRIARGLIQRKRYKLLLQRHIIIRRQICSQYWYDSIITPIFNTVDREYQRAQEQFEQENMYYEDQLTQRFTQYQRTQSVIMGLEAVLHGLRHIVGKSSILIPVVDDLGVPIRWTPSYCFTFDALKDVLFRRPPLRRLFTMQQYAEIAQFYPRFADTFYRKESFAYMSDPDIIRILSRFILTKQRNAIKFDRLLVQEDHKKQQEMQRQQALLKLKLKNETALQRANRLKLEQQQQSQQPFHLHNSEGNNHKGETAVEKLKRLRQGSGQGSTVESKEEDFEGYKSPGENCWKKIMVYNGRIFPPFDCDEYVRDKLPPIPTYRKQSSILAEEAAERERVRLLKQAQYEKEQQKKLFKANTNNKQKNNNNNHINSKNTNNNATKPSSSQSSRPTTSHSTSKSPFNTTLTAINNTINAINNKNNDKNNDNNAAFANLEPYYFPYDHRLGPDSYKSSFFSVFKPIYQPPLWSFRRHSICDPCDLYQRTLQQPKLIRGRAFLKRSFSMGPGILHCELKNYLLEKDIDLKLKNTHNTNTNNTNNNNKDKNKPKKDAYGYLIEDKEDIRYKIKGSTTRMSPYAGNEYVPPEDRLKILQAFQQERVRLKEEAEAKEREIQRQLYLLKKQQQEQQEEERKRSRGRKASTSVPTSTTASTSIQTSTTHNINIHNNDKTTSSEAPSAFVRHPARINVYSVSLPDLHPLKQAHRSRKTDVQNSLSLFTLRTQFLSDFRENIATWATQNEGPMFENRKSFVVSQFKQTLIESCLFFPRLPSELNSWIRTPKRRRSLGGSCERYAQQLQDVLSYRELAQEALLDGYTECVLPRRTRSFDFGEIKDKEEHDILNKYLGFTSEYYWRMDDESPLPNATNTHNKTDKRMIKLSSLRQDAMDMQERMLVCGFLQQERDTRAQSRQEEKRRRMQARKRRSEMKRLRKNKAKKNDKNKEVAEGSDSANETDDDEEDDDDEELLQEDQDELTQALRVARENVASKFKERRQFLRNKRLLEGISVGGAYLNWLQEEKKQEEAFFHQKNLTKEEENNDKDATKENHLDDASVKWNVADSSKSKKLNKNSIFTRHKISLEQSTQQERRDTVATQQDTKAKNTNRNSHKGLNPPPSDFDHYLGMVQESEESSSSSYDKYNASAINLWQEHVYYHSDGTSQYYYYHPYSGTSVWSVREMCSVAVSYFDPQHVHASETQDTATLEDTVMVQHDWVRLERQFYDENTGKWYWFNEKTGGSRWVDDDTGNSDALYENVHNHDYITTNHSYANQEEAYDDNDDVQYGYY